MYPGSIINFDDQSNVSQLPIEEVRNMPLFGAVFTSDKGPEKWMRISGKDFFETYGKTISFARHGQPLLQAAASINAGAELLCKRLVADDATLAHLAIIVKVNINQGNTPTSNQYSITYRTVFSNSAETLLEAKKSIETGLTTNEYLLYIIGDNGRGTSKKRIKINPDYKISKSQNHPMYVLSVLEGSEELETISFSTDPNLIINGENVSLPNMVNTYSKQVTCLVGEGTKGFDGYLAALKTIIDNVKPKASITPDSGANYTEEDMYGFDILFAKELRGTSIERFTYDTINSTTQNPKIDISISTGLELSGGNNGILGDYPFKNDTNTDDVEGSESEGSESEGSETTPSPSVRNEWIKQAVAALNGTFDTSIYNVDQHKITAFIDANYPTPVKDAIEALAEWREDFMFFRDYGLGNTDLEKIREINSTVTNRSKFVAHYCQDYDIIDPYTKKQINVTIGYSLAKLLVAHCNNGCILPTAGIKHSMIIDDIVYGTLSFSPVVCPDVNQKEELCEMKVNFASYIDNQLVIETLYTSQDKDTQWSFINNVMGVQEVVKAIRTRCPINRYTFIDGEDLERYKAEVTEVIEPFSSNFKHISLKFVSDKTYAANKIFYAVLEVVYNDFVQTEWFRVTALSTQEVINA